MSDQPKQPDRLLKAILIWTAIPGVFFWLPFIRGAIDGPSYEWGLGTIGGSGVAGDYWIIALIVAFTATVLYLGWRGGRGPFPVLLLLWHVPFGLLGLAGVLFYRDAIPPLRGDTLDVAGLDSANSDRVCSAGDLVGRAPARSGR